MHMLIQGWYIQIHENIIKNIANNYANDIQKEQGCHCSEENKFQNVLC